MTFSDILHKVIDSLTLSFSLKVKYDLSDFNVLTCLINLGRSAMLDSYATNIIYIFNAVGIHRADRRARQEKRPGGCAAACDAAQTRPAADAALAIWPAPAVPAGARIRSPEQQPEGRWAFTRQCARRQPRSQPWAERAAQGRSVRPLGPLVIVPQEVAIK